MGLGRHQLYLSTLAPTSTLLQVGAPNQCIVLVPQSCAQTLCWEAAQRNALLRTYLASACIPGLLVTGGTAKIIFAAGAGIAYLLYRRPRFAKITGAIGAIIVGPYLVFTTPVIRKYQNFAENVVKAAEQAHSEGHAGFQD